MTIGMLTADAIMPTFRTLGPATPAPATVLSWHDKPCADDGPVPARRLGAPRERASVKAKKQRQLLFQQPLQNSLEVRDGFRARQDVGRANPAIRVHPSEEERRGSRDLQGLGFRPIRLDELCGFGSGPTRIVEGEVKANLAGGRAHVLVIQLDWLGEQSIVHLPELALLPSA